MNSGPCAQPRTGVGGGGHSAHEYLSSKYLQSLLKGWVHRAPLDSRLAFSLGGSVRQQIGLYIPRGQRQTEVKAQGGGDEGPGRRE